MKKKYYVAIDVGGTSVKMILASFDKKSVKIEDEFSFQNPSVRACGNLYINLLEIFQSIKTGLSKFTNQGATVSTIGIDTFGNGYGILDKNGKLIGIPFHYRNPLDPEIAEKMEEIMPQKEIYKLTGVHLMKSNVLVQLYNEVLLDSPAIREGQHYLPFPGVLYYLLTDTQQIEQTIASVSNLLSEGAQAWNETIIEKFGLPHRLFGEIVPGGSVMAPLTHEVQVETGCTEANVVNIAGHDTETALVAAPKMDERTMFVSIGTAIIFGTQTDAPVINENSYSYHFKNSYGALGRNTLCKDISGFWILNQCLTQWQKKQRDLDYADLTMLAANSKENRTYINVNDPIFRTLPDNMLDCIRSYCERTGQPVPSSIGEVTRMMLESYTMQIMYSRKCLEEITGRTDYDEIVVLNGGVRNPLLMQMIADATGCRVTTGSEYASVLGNVLLQLHAVGEAESLDELREIARNSSFVKHYEPNKTEKWNEALVFMKTNGLFEC